MGNKVTTTIFSDNSPEAAVFTNAGVLSIRDLSGCEKKTLK